MLEYKVYFTLEVLLWASSAVNCCDAAVLILDSA